MSSETESLLLSGIQTEDARNIHSPLDGYIREISHGERKQTNLSFMELYACGIACFGSLSMGLAIGYSSPVNDELLAKSILNKDQSTWFSSLVTLGAIFGGPLAGYLAEKLGRKLAVMLTSIPYVLGWFLIPLTHQPYVLYLGRILTGLGAGMTTLSVPLYVAEISPKEHRGALGSGISIGATSGNLCAFSLGLCLNWEWLATISAIFSFLSVVLLLPVPESPRWFLMKDQKHECIAALVRLRTKNTKEEIHSECMEMEVSLIEQAMASDYSWSSLLNEKSLRRPLTMSLLLMVFQQFCGINAVIFYTQLIFASSGYKGNAGIPSLIVSSVQVFITLFMTSIIDRAGRKPLFIIGGIGMAISCTGLGIYFYLDIPNNPNNLNWVSLTSLILYVISFNLGWGVIPWVIMSEIFPSKARGRASGISTAVNWTCAFIVTKTFIPLQELISAYGVFWLFAGVCILGSVYALLCMLETKGKSLEQIEQCFQHGNPICC